MHNIIVLLLLAACSCVFGQEYSNPNMSAIVFNFNEKMDASNIYDVNNYVLKDINNNKYNIYLIGTLSNKTDITFIYIFCEKLDTTKSYTIEAWNVKNSKGKVINTSNNRKNVTKIF